MRPERPQKSRDGIFGPGDRYEFAAVDILAPGDPIVVCDADKGVSCIPILPEQVFRLKSAIRLGRMAVELRLAKIAWNGVRIMNSEGHALTSSQGEE